MINCFPIDRCIACGGSDLIEVFDLGLQPLANSYKKTVHESESYFPLAINSCKTCRHVQLTHRVNPDLLFKNYAYTSGVSKTALDFFTWFAKTSLTYFDNQPKTVLDIGCNDGSQLDIYKELGLQTFGVDPAKNHYQETRKRHEIVCDFFKAGLFDRAFDMILVQNAFAHNNDQLRLLQNIKTVMTDGSLLFVVTSHADMLANGEFDTVYHEHLSFYNCKSMNALCKRAGLNLIDVVRHPIHGNSYIFVISTAVRNDYKIDKIIDEEGLRGLYSEEILENFSKKTTATADKAKTLFAFCQDKQIPIVGYSAPAKSSTFLNYTKIKPQFIIDDTVFKQNTYTPGVTIPIYNSRAFDIINNYDTVCFIIFAWNFYEEIRAKITKARPDKNDMFIKFFPKYTIE